MTATSTPIQTKELLNRRLDDNIKIMFDTFDNIIRSYRV
jgi:hypothetical protein